MTDFREIQDEHLSKVLEGWINSLNIHNVNARIGQNEVGNRDLTISSKKSSKMRGRENLTTDELFKYLNIMYDALHMSQY